MAGSSISVSAKGTEIKGVINKEIVLSVACVSDDTNGTVPDRDLNGFGDYVVTELKPVPDAVAPPTLAFSAILVDADGAEVFDSGDIAPGATDPIGGHAGHPSGLFPRMDESMTFKLVSTANHAVAANLGNSKEIVFKLRLELK
jgi:hypothetical protein